MSNEFDEIERDWANARERNKRKPTLREWARIIAHRTERVIGRIECFLFEDHYVITFFALGCSAAVLAYYLATTVPYFTPFLNMWREFGEKKLADATMADLLTAALIISIFNRGGRK